MGLHSDEFDDTPNHHDGDSPRPQPESFGHRHGLKVLGVIMAAMFALVLTVQVAC